MDLLNDNEYIVVEDRGYINPQVALDESNQFIDNLRSTQQANNQQIQTDTYNLGTAVPSQLGGLTGGESYFTSRYQTPQTNATVANLRATAQAAALNQALQNEQAKWKKRYQDAYNAYQRRAWNRGNPSGGGGGDDGLKLDTNESQGGKTYLSQYKDGQYEKETLYPASDYVYDWQDASGQWWQVGTPTFRDVGLGPSNYPLTEQTNGNITTVNGRDYIYLDNVPNQSPQWFPITRSAGPGTYSPYAGD